MTPKVCKGLVYLPSTKSYLQSCVHPIKSVCSLIKERKEVVVMQKGKKKDDDLYKEGK